MPLSTADFILTGVHGPAAKARYVSNAYITPAGPTGEAEPASTVEARALEPVPHSLALKGRYDRKTHAAVLTGRVVQAGRPQARAPVLLYAADSLTKPRRLETHVHGVFAVRIRISTTTTFAAKVDDATGPCGGTSAAPAGCASLTVTGTNTASTRVAVTR